VDRSVPPVVHLGAVAVGPSAVPPDAVRPSDACGPEPLQGACLAARQDAADTAVSVPAAWDVLAVFAQSAVPASVHLQGAALQSRAVLSAKPQRDALPSVRQVEPASVRALPVERDVRLPVGRAALPVRSVPPALPGESVLAQDASAHPQPLV